MKLFHNRIVRILGLIAAVGVFGQSTVTHAAEKFLSKKNGIRMGPVLFHPGIDLGFSYDSNVFYSSEAGGSGSALVITPQFNFLTNKSTNTQFALSLKAKYLHYLTGTEHVKNLNDISVTADLSLGFNTAGAVSFYLIDVFQRTTEPRSMETSGQMDRDYNQAGFKLEVHPGGKAMVFSLHYYFDIDFYEGVDNPCPISFPPQGCQADPQLFNLKRHKFYFRYRWKFFPKTALLADINLNLLSYDKAALVPDLVNAMPFRASVGLTGNITARLRLVAMAGFGHSLHDSGESFTSVIGRLLLSYYFRRGTYIQLEYERTFFPSTWGNYFSVHSVGMVMNLNISRLLSLTLSPQYQHLSFSNNPQSAPLVTSTYQLPAFPRADNLLRLTLQAQFKITKWFAPKITYELEYRKSNMGLYSGTVLVKQLLYTKHRIGLYLTFVY